MCDKNIWLLMQGDQVKFGYKSELFKNRIQQKYSDPDQAADMDMDPAFNIFKNLNLDAV